MEIGPCAPRVEGGILKTNHLATLVDSYHLATKQPPPAGQILVHNQIRSTPQAYEGARGFRAWWTRPGRHLSLCACGWRPDLGEHYRIRRVGIVIGRQ
jgi:hypothetical protein